MYSIILLLPRMFCLSGGMIKYDKVSKRITKRFPSTKRSLNTYFYITNINLLLNNFRSCGNVKKVHKRLYLNENCRRNDVFIKFNPCLNNTRLKFKKTI